ncbi:MAG: DNA polymerase Y family protein, partial [Cyclobacteriaceae bacterium]
MDKRYVSIWFSHLATDWFSLRQPELNRVPFVLRTPSHGRMIVTATNSVAQQLGITEGIVLADARAMVPNLKVLDDKPDLRQKLLSRLAEWCIRFTPSVAIDLPDGLFLDASGCSHLWGGDDLYVSWIIKKLNERGYNVNASMADTPGAAWAFSRYGNGLRVIEVGQHIEALLSLPSESLRIEPDVVAR